MRFDIVSIFPRIFDSYFNESILKRAQKKGLIKIYIHNLRDYSSDKKHRKVDDRPYGGGPGMVLKIEPIYRAVQSARTKNKKSTFVPSPLRVRASESRTGRGKTKNKPPRTRVILLSAKGRQFDERMAEQLARLDQLILICGHYEGVDERVAKYVADEEVSVGPYIITGGEIPAMLVVDAVTRLLPGVLGKAESLEHRRSQKLPNYKFSLDPEFRTKGQIPNSRPHGYSVYTRPGVFSPRRLADSRQKVVQWRVPKMLLSGNHKKIEEWRKITAHLS
ncbi:MAG: tRNA (guanosine(37)-N1)-methyltransferase TrmD [Parcubacteria group bacterium RIFCSPLOWO2_01_FULL_48_18]|nr:MAG: tRNA (guanosine(37)-N1)-methyltransferase TrmD [Parcubacteria group bacterium RIFCSPHIGHO2_02_FULL_48_10b]OHB23241.1 MAG: tRNA (guanosine(37)-N1)-methyltransferase TrmD [Parcubacteria group bacterium RIFCSPLOWO2_01_FULL_48_18]